MVGVSHLSSQLTNPIGVHMTLMTRTPGAQPVYASYVAHAPWTPMILQQKMPLHPPTEIHYQRPVFSGFTTRSEYRSLAHMLD